MLKSGECFRKGGGGWGSLVEWCRMRIKAAFSWNINVVGTTGIDAAENAKFNH